MSQALFRKVAKHSRVLHLVRIHCPTHVVECLIVDTARQVMLRLHNLLLSCAPKVISDGSFVDMIASRELGLQDTGQCDEASLCRRLSLRIVLEHSDGFFHTAMQGGLVQSSCQKLGHESGRYGHSSSVDI